MVSSCLFCLDSCHLSFWQYISIIANFPVQLQYEVETIVFVSFETLMNSYCKFFYNFKWCSDHNFLNSSIFWEMETFLSSMKSHHDLLVIIQLFELLSSNSSKMPWINFENLSIMILSWCLIIVLLYMNLNKMLVAKWNGVSPALSLVSLQ